jgi:hemolysin D
VRHANRIIVMDKGKIVEGGTHESLLNRPKGIYAHLWNMQGGGHPTEGAGAGGGRAGGMTTTEVSTTAPAANAPRARHAPPGPRTAGTLRAIFKAAWKHRHELAGPGRLSDEAAFLPAALSLQDTPVHPAPRRLAYALIALFLIALTWAIFGQIDIVAVAPGKIIVSERTKIIQPLEVSVVKRVLVRDGDHVEAGQALVELDPTTANADKTSIDEQLKSMQSEVLRTRVLLQALNSPASARTLELGKSIPTGWTEVDTAATQAQLSR